VIVHIDLYLTKTLDFKQECKCIEHKREKERRGKKEKREEKKRREREKQSNNYLL
jgi:hypothetical protein